MSGHSKWATIKRKKAATVRRRKPEEEGDEGAAPAVRKRTHIRRTGANTAAPRRERLEPWQGDGRTHAAEQGPP